MPSHIRANSPIKNATTDTATHSSNIFRNFRHRFSVVCRMQQLNKNIINIAITKADAIAARTFGVITKGNISNPLVTRYAEPVNKPA